ncbi:glycosyltransferase [candidate division GN15 bacterium]|nr:glycosyltransferase [candidate division GN15 bacterium]
MSDPVRLLCLTHNFPRYRGDYAGVFIDLLSRRLVEHGIHSTIIAPHYPDAPEYEERDELVIYRFRYTAREKDETLAYGGAMQKALLSLGGMFKFRHFLKRFRQTALKIIAEQEPDVIAGHWLMPAGIVMKQLSRRVNLPMVLSSHGTDVRLVSKFGGLSYRYFGDLGRRLERWTFVSSYLREQILSIDPRLVSIAETLPLPHNEEVFYRDKTVNREPYLVVAVTRYTEQKRVDQLIRAFGQVADMQKEAHLALYGAGPLEDNIAELIEENSLSGSVSMHPPVAQEKLREVYNRASVVVLNSVNEGFGLALSEAMLCGAAVIGTRSGGIVDIIKHEKTGLLIPPDNETALARAIGRLLQNEALRDRLAEAGYEHARTTYASQALAGRYAEIVRSAVASGVRQV